jgi:death-on-curing protein
VTGSGDAGEALYLDVENVLDLYAEIFGCTLQEAEDQLLSRDGLEAALARPQSYALYQEADIALQAAVLAHGIAAGQHLVEGNKRTALAALRTFLYVNGYGVSAPQAERAAWILDLSSGLSVDGLAARIWPALTAR